MNTTINNQFVCECCGTTAPRFDEEITVTLIANDGVTYKKVCYDCAEKMQQTDPRYLCKTSRYFNPEIQERKNHKEKERMERYEQDKNEFLTENRDFKMVKKMIGTRHYEGFVDVIDPSYGFDPYEGKRLHVATGEYTCVMWDLDYTFTLDGKDYHVSEMDTMGIYLNGKIPAHDDMIRVGCAGVDSGLLGIFDVREDLNLAYWVNDKLRADPEDLYVNAIQDVGFIASLSDGGVEVFVAIEHSEIVAVEIRLCDYIHRGQ